MAMPEENCWLNHSLCRGRTFQPPGLLLVKNLKIGKRYLTVIAGSVGQKPQKWREQKVYLTVMVAARSQPANVFSRPLNIPSCATTEVTMEYMWMPGMGALVFCTTFSDENTIDFLK